MEENKKFYIKKDNQKYTATIITNFNINNNNYCIYSIPVKKEFNVYCAKLINGKLIPIENPNEKKLTDKVVKEFVKVTKKKEEEE